MRFRCDGRAYDTLEMHEYSTGDAAAPAIYVTSDLHEVFVRTSDGRGAMSVHRADMLETICLAGRYGLDELFNTFPAHFAPAAVENHAASALPAVAL